MGEVWRALHVASSLPVAVKLITKGLADERAFLAAFRREAEAVARLDHPNVVAVLDYGTVSAQAERDTEGRLRRGSPFLVMELVTGGGLHKQRVPRTWPELRRIFATLLDALGYAHARGVLHRDLKPSNVLVASADDARPGLRLIDFGLAAAAQHGGPIAEGLSGGTPAYMAPEQVVHATRDQGPWTDLYAFGCLAYALASGRPPFTGDPDEIMRAHLVRDVPPLRSRVPAPVGLDAWIARLLAKRVVDRFARAADATFALFELGERARAGTMQAVEDSVPVAPSTRPSVPAESATRPSEPRSTLLERRGGAGEPRPASSATRVAPPPDLWDLLSDAVAALGPPPVTPPMPRDWREPRDRRRVRERLEIAGAGLALLGMREIPLVDREPERTVLWRALRDVVASGGTRVVVLEGPTGAGKSRLARWLAERADETGAATVLGAVHGPIPGPASGIAPMVARHVGAVGLEHADALRRIERVLRFEGESTPDEWAALAELVAPEPERADGESAAGEGGARVRFGSAEERHALVLRVLRRAAKRRPVLVWLDDVQWGADAIGFAAHALASNAAFAAPILFVATVRDEELPDRRDEAERLEQLVRERGVSRLALRPLGRTAHAGLVRGLLGLTGDLARRVEERTAGNPLFAVHLVDEWARRGELVSTPRGYALRAGARVELPRDVGRLWRERVQAVMQERSADERVALELAAVLGQDVDADEWREVAEEAGVGLDDGVADALVRRRLARREERGLVFAHGMVREAIETLAREEGRAALHHRACAAVLARSTDPASAERIGRHLLAAGAPADALEPLLDGARRHLRFGDLRAALTLLDARDEAMRELRVPARDDRWGDGWIVRARAHKLLGQFDDVHRWATRAASGARKHAWPRIAPHALHLLGTVAQQRGDVARVRTFNERALALFVAANDDHGHIDALWALAWAARQRGELDLAERILADAMHLAIGLGDATEQGDCWRGLAQVAVRRGDFAAALARERGAVEAYERGGHRMGLVYAHNGAGEAARFSGDGDAAERAYRRALAVADAMGTDEGVFPRMNLAFLLVGRGEHVLARAEIEEVIRVLERTGRRVFLFDAELARLACVVAEGDEAGFRRARPKVDRMLAKRRVHERDAAIGAQIVGETFEKRGSLDRAAWAYRIALGEWDGIGAKREADAVRAALARCTE